MYIQTAVMLSWTLIKKKKPVCVGLCFWIHCIGNVKVHPPFTFITFCDNKTQQPWRCLAVTLDVSLSTPNICITNMVFEGKRLCLTCFACCSDVPQLGDAACKETPFKAGQMQNYHVYGSIKVKTIFADLRFGLCSTCMSHTTKRPLTWALFRCLNWGSLRWSENSYYA